MSIEAALVALLKADSGIAALVGDRIWPLYIQQGETRACLTFQEIDGPEEVSTDGPIGLIDGRFQINCWAPTHAACVALRDDLARVIHSYKFGVTIAGMTIQGMRILDRGDVPALDDQAETLTRYGKLLDVQISYNDS